MINSTEHENCCHTNHHHPHISWAAIFAGALVGVGLGFLLHLFASAIGLSVYTSNTTGGQVIAMGGIIGFIISVVVAMLASGYVAGYLSNFHHCHCHGGLIYGFTTWSLSLVLSALLVFPLVKYNLAYKYSLSHAAVMTKVSNHAMMDMHNTKASEPKAMHEEANMPVTTDDLVWGAWIIFALFIIGAISCCIGACWGLCSCKSQMDEHSH